jgi:hypothetical protein
MRPLANQRGQFMIEGLLIMVVFMGLVAIVASFFKKNEIFENLVKAPWTSLAGMLQNGEWLATAQSQTMHPSQSGRHVTILGDKP